MIIKKIIKLCSILHDPVLVHALLKGTMAGMEHRKVLCGLSCMHVVDIGANRGQFALIARKCFPKARIDSYEPLIEPSSIYRFIFKKDQHVYLHHCAIGPKVSKGSIHVSEHDDSSSLLPISSLQEAMFPGTAEKETRSVDICPLEETLSAEDIRDPALLKLDVQGYELQALQGCESLLHRFCYVYVECSFVELYVGQNFANDVVAWLSGRSFILVGVYNMIYNIKGQAVQADFMFSYQGV